MSLQDLGKKADDLASKAKSQADEAANTFKGMDKKEKKWLRIVGWTILVLFCILGLSMCMSSCSKPKTVAINGQSYPVDKHGIPYAQDANGGYVPAPGYQSYGQPIAPSGPGFWTGALVGAGVGHLLTKQSAPVPQYTPAPTQAVVNTPNPGPAVVSKPVPTAVAPTQPAVNPRQAEIDAQKKIQADQAVKAEQAKLAAKPVPVNKPVVNNEPKLPPKSPTINLSKSSSGSTMKFSGKRR